MGRFEHGTMSFADRCSAYRNDVAPIFAETPFHQHLLRAVDWIEESAPDSFGLTAMADALGIDLQDAQLYMPMINALTGTRIHLLDAHLRFGTEDGEMHRVTVLDDATGKHIMHPITGARIDDYASQCYFWLDKAVDA